MKTCPNCGELLGDGVDECFNCHYNYTLGRVPNDQDIEKRRLEEQKEQLEEQKRHQAELEKERADKEREQEIRNQYEQELLKNSRYEYSVETIVDTDSGAVDTVALSNVLTQYASNGWRLKSVFTDEIGKNSNNSGVGGITSGTNATIEQVIMIFERCVFHGED